MCFAFKKDRSRPDMVAARQVAEEGEVRGFHASYIGMTLL